MNEIVEIVADAVEASVSGASGKAGWIMAGIIVLIGATIIGFALIR